MYKNKFGRRKPSKRIIDHMLSLLADKDFQDEKYEERLQRMCSSWDKLSASQ